MSITLKGIGYEHTISEQRMYSDATPMVKVENFEEMVARADTMILRPKGMAEFVTAMFLADAVWGVGGQLHKLVIPYVPGARQDRSNPTGDVLFTAKSVARMINHRGFNKVVILDPHSPTTPSLIHNVFEYPLSRVARMLPNNHDGIIVPDKGARDRAEQFADTLELPIFYGGKTRDVSTGRLSGFTLESIPQGHYLVVDDICDGGGTFVGLADKIREQGSTADLYVTHGIFSKGTRELLEAYNTIYTTDSLAGSERDNDVTVLAVVEEMENY